VYPVILGFALSVVLGLGLRGHLESLNKELNTSILITDVAYKVVKEEILVDQPQLLSVRGRSDVIVYPVLGLKGAQQ